MRLGNFILVTCLLILFSSSPVSNVMGSLPEMKPVPHPRTGRPDVRIIKGKIKKGDTISVLLDPYLPLKTIYRLNHRSTRIFSLQKMQPGKPYRITVQKGRMTRFEYNIDMADRLVIQKCSDGFTMGRLPVEYTTTLETVSATITSSLFEAVRKSGEQCELALKLSGIFAWDIDFIRDIRPEDNFRVLVEKRFYEGKFSGYGKVRAASFTNRGKTFNAFLHKTAAGSEGYYDENGSSLQKAFLKAPLEFSRISSKFALKRMHPILKEYRSHPGVDYAAPEGTPVKTVGDGIIAAFGHSSTTGNYVMIRHSNGYTTRYYHLSGFPEGMRHNRKVLQGDIIGYVGMTGYATGPHLCFRMQKDGRAVDPLTHKFPSATPVAPVEMDQFQARIRKLAKKINKTPQVRVTAIRDLTGKQDS